MMEAENSNHDITALLEKDKLIVSKALCIVVGLSFGTGILVGVGGTLIYFYLF